MFMGAFTDGLAQRLPNHGSKPSEPGADMHLRVGQIMPTLVAATRAIASGLLIGLGVLTLIFITRFFWGLSLVLMQF
jgi:hypothetical protein